MSMTIYRHGEPKMIDYTPTGGNVSAGDVVLIGNTAGWTCGIAHVDIANNTLGALAAGDGIYHVVNENNAATGTKVWWDATNSAVTTTSTNNALFGFIVEGGGGGTNTYCRALHHPYV